MQRLEAENYGEFMAEPTRDSKGLLIFDDSKGNSPVTGSTAGKQGAGGKPPGKPPVATIGPGGDGDETPFQPRNRIANPLKGISPALDKALAAPNINSLTEVSRLPSPSPEQLDSEKIQAVAPDLSILNSDPVSFAKMLGQLEKDIDAEEQRKARRDKALRERKDSPVQPKQNVLNPNAQPPKPFQPAPKHVSEEPTTPVPTDIKDAAPQGATAEKPRLTVGELALRALQKKPYTVIATLSAISLTAVATFAFGRRSTETLVSVPKLDIHHFAPTQQATNPMPLPEKREDKVNSALIATAKSTDSLMPEAQQLSTPQLLILPEDYIHKDTAFLKNLILKEMKYTIRFKGDWEKGLLDPLAPCSNGDFDKAPCDALYGVMYEVMFEDAQGNQIRFRQENNKMARPKFQPKDIIWFVEFNDAKEDKNPRVLFMPEIEAMASHPGAKVKQTFELDPRITLLLKDGTVPNKEGELQRITPTEVEIILNQWKNPEENIVEIYKNELFYVMREEWLRLRAAESIRLDYGFAFGLPAEYSLEDIRHEALLRGLQKGQAHAP